MSDGAVKVEISEEVPAEKLASLQFRLNRNSVCAEQPMELEELLALSEDERMQVVLRSVRVQSVLWQFGHYLTGNAAGVEEYSFSPARYTPPRRTSALRRPERQPPPCRCTHYLRIRLALLSQTANKIMPEALAGPEQQLVAASRPKGLQPTALVEAATRANEG